MKKILLSLLMSLVVANSIVVTTVQAATDFEATLERVFGTEKKGKRVRSEDYSDLPATRRYRVTAREEKVDNQKKIILAIVAALGISYYFGKDVFSSIKGKITRALSGEENPVDYALGELVGGFMGKAAQVVDLPTEKDIAQAHRVCEKLKAELIKAHKDDKAEITAELNEALRQKLDMELTLYGAALNKAADVALEAANDKKELIEKRDEIKAELAENKKSCEQLQRDLAAVSDEEEKDSFRQEVNAFEARNKELESDLKLVQEAFEKVSKELIVQSEDDARLHPNKRTNHAKLERKYNDVKKAWDKLPEELKEQTKKEKEEKEQAREYLKRKVTGTVKREGGMRSNRRGVTSVLDDEDFKTDAQALTSVVSAVLRRLA